MEKEILNAQEPQAEAIVDTQPVEAAQVNAQPVAEQIVQQAVQPQAESSVDTQQGDFKGFDFKFFRNCSASLKRFSILIFVINLFISLGIVGALTVVLAISLGTQMLSLLALPIVTLFVILVVIARFVSALVYGFAEIVEKAEKN